MGAKSDPAGNFDALFAAYHADVLAYVVRRTSLASAEDVLAETFLVAWRRADRVPTDPLPWLLGVARRVLANQRRGELRRGALAGRLAGLRSGTPGPWEAPSTLSPELAAALASLSERQREALLLTAWDGLDPDRAASAAGCSAATFRVRLHRARKRVAAQLDASTASPSITRTSEDTP
jgi:DNA-directed RNA polymerase specialized sigma24 family protein